MSTFITDIAAHHFCNKFIHHFCEALHATWYHGAAPHRRHQEQAADSKRKKHEQAGISE